MAKLTRRLTENSRENPLVNTFHLLFMADRQNRAMGGIVSAMYQSVVDCDLKFEILENLASIAPKFEKEGDTSLFSDELKQILRRVLPMYISSFIVKEGLNRSVMLERMTDLFLTHEIIGCGVNAPPEWKGLNDKVYLIFAPSEGERLYSVVEFINRGSIETELRILELTQVFEYFGYEDL